VDYDYDAAGRLVRKTLGNGVYTTCEYDAAGQLTTLVNRNPEDAVLLVTCIRKGAGARGKLGATWSLKNAPEVGAG